MEKLDKIFSEYVRLRDADDNGYIRCYCCGSAVFWKHAQNGHYINRRHMGVRFADANCHSCCVNCNVFACGNLEAYKKHLLYDYGETIFPILEMQKRLITKLSADEIKEMTRHYKRGVKRLKKEKGL